MNKDTVIKVHEFLTEYFAESEDPISPPGVKDEGLLDSAVVRKDMTAGNCDIFEGVFNKAAALFHGVINNHAFYNGNKRSALLSTIVYLGENGYWVTKCDDAEMFEFTRQIAAHELHEDRKQEISIIAEWLKLNSRRRDIREKRLNLQQFIFFGRIDLGILKVSVHFHKLTMLVTPEYKAFQFFRAELTTGWRD